MTEVNFETKKENIMTRCQADKSETI